MPSPVSYTSVRVYGTQDCPDTTDVRARLERYGISFDFIDLAQDPGAAAMVRQRGGGRERKPVVDVAGELLDKPSAEVLKAKLQAKGLAPKRA